MDNKIITGLYGGLTSIIIILIIWGLSSITVFLLATSSEKGVDSFINTFNILVIIGLTFAIGLFTYHSIIPTEDKKHKQRMRIYSKISFACILLFILGVALIHTQAIQPVEPQWVNKILGFAHLAGSYITAIVLFVFYFIFLSTITELIKSSVKDILEI